MTREWFDLQLGRMLPLKAMPGDTDEYFAALSDLPEDVLQAAIAQALKTRVWFPTPAELRADADAAVRSRPVSLEPSAARVVDLRDGRRVVVRNPLGGKDLVLTVTKDWYHDCSACEDTGWQTHWCGDDATAAAPWLLRKRCDQQKEHSAHEWVEPCVCRDTNPTIRRRIAAGARYATPAEKVEA